MMQLIICYCATMLMAARKNHNPVKKNWKKKKKKETIDYWLAITIQPVKLRFHDEMFHNLRASKP